MTNQDRKTIDEIRVHKGQTPLVVLTAYTAPMAALLDDSCDILLVGDSLGMVLYGMDSTQGVSLTLMIEHGKAVMRGARSSFVVVDMPYGTYEHDPKQALESAKTLLNETGCGAVKLEGGQDMAATIEYLVQNGVPVMGHIGLLPQSAPDEGGYKIKGKTEEDEARLIEDAKTLEGAGAFAIVIEGTIETVSQKITDSVSIPTIGIGASASCDGQVLVTEDMLGMLPQKPPKFVKEYANLKTDIEKAVRGYAQEVRDGSFPGSDYVYKK